MISSIVKSSSNGYAEPSCLSMRRRKQSLLGGGGGKVILVMTPSANHPASFFTNIRLSPDFFNRAVVMFSNLLTFLVTHKNAPESLIISATLVLDILSS